MPWGRVDDTYYDHAKVRKMPRAVRNAASGLYWRAISLCNRQMTDGVVTAEDLELLDATPEEVVALTRAGLFERRGKRLQIHDYLEFNKSRAQILEERDKRSELGRLGGLASAEKRAAREPRKPKPPREKAPPTGGQPPGEPHGSDAVQPPSRPVPSRPVPSGELPNGSAPAPGAPFEASRHGMPHVGPDVQAVVERIVGRSLSTLHGSWAGELDRLVEQRSVARVIAAAERAAERYGADPPAWPQLVASIRNDLEPLPGAKRSETTTETPAERFARERAEIQRRIDTEGRTH